ncbi:TPA: GIY-YIG nuclease superfamily protein [Candidatus Marinimicrobia bacterium]|nr:GIY-YIG nuclease superfamily protein [Candidatus Neomarinimicrobiota bacterium]HBY18211.1 GIY-YIG nuclease superfamily protein [Candidatus Neomarinimicrobiota bacterium]
MNYTYILYSKKADPFYVGYTSDLEERLKRHHDHKISYTSKRGPREFVWYKTFDSKSAAYACSRAIKKNKRGKYIESLVNYFSQNASSSSVH